MSASARSQRAGIPKARPGAPTPRRAGAGRGAVTVGYDGPGHVMYLSGKKCPIEHATRYLTTLRLPGPGTVCPAE
ncbi:alpha/beta hydrolase [Nonomuraea dietziae]|uniref:alpha/beta hydrolase n=1 Tax=Nonomuraea dietziae TaxID=65515 RepID=UPI0033FAFD19